MAISIRSRDDKRMFLPSDVLAMHHSRQWLTEQLAILHDRPAVVITHHAPHRNSIPLKVYADDLVKAAFVSDLTSLLEKADLWIHGHTYCSRDYHVGNPLVTAIRRGSLARSLVTSYGPKQAGQMGAGEGAAASLTSPVDRTPWTSTYAKSKKLFKVFLAVKPGTPNG